MDNYYEDGWLEQAYEDRFYYDDIEDGMRDACPLCSEHFMDCLCDEEELHDRD